MYIGYFDEVKADRAQGRDNYLVAGLIIPMDQIGPIELQMTTLAEDLFGSRELVQETEFHADHIYRGKGNFKGKSMADRAAVLGKLAKFIGDNQYVSKVWAAIDTSKIYNPDQAPEFAFAHFVERVQMCVWDRPCVLICDQDDEQARNMVRDFSKYRAKGTPWAHGIELKTVVDTVHFSRSHHSRLIQLADAFAWLTVQRWGLRKGDMSKLVDEAINGVQSFSEPLQVLAQQLALWNDSGRARCEQHPVHSSSLLVRQCAGLPASRRNPPQDDEERPALRIC